MIKTLSQKAKPMGIPLVMLAMIVVVTITPHAFATTFTDANNPHGPLEPVAWGAAFAVIGIMSGVGILTTIQRDKLRLK
ncbi:MAG: hypothetical protein ACREAR_06475 [Nitrosotalea sp.]